MKKEENEPNTDNRASKTEEVKPKSILKKSKSPTKKRMKWDEANIKENEEIQTEILNTIKKIDEPKTPYYSYTNDGTESPDSFKLNTSSDSDERDSPRIQKKSEWDTSESEEEKTPDEVKRRQEFIEKRKAHYDEYRVLKEWKRMKKFEEEIDSDDE